MNNEYRHTFFSVETGGQLLRRLFLEGDDVSKAQVFKKHRSLWAPIRDKVAAWAKEGWATWEEEKPDWFTDKWKSMVPEAMKPTKGKGDFDGGDKKVAEKSPLIAVRDLKVGRGEEDNGRRRSIADMIIGQKATSYKVMPAEGEVKEKIDGAKFAREMNRRGSIDF
ncbi:hypothetical protein TrST_g13453 [Triparma strigata]|nr:hypothetical protein TrST_g13453 [Triparma strigata]